MFNMFIRSRFLARAHSPLNFRNGRATRVDPIQSFRGLSRKQKGHREHDTDEAQSAQSQRNENDGAARFNNETKYSRTYQHLHLQGNRQRW